jgi:hypothetical protein
MLITSQKLSSQKIDLENFPQADTINTPPQNKEGTIKNLKRQKKEGRRKQGRKMNGSRKHDF